MTEELYEVHGKNAGYINKLDSEPHKVQASRKQKSSSDYDASGLQYQRKPGKRRRSSYDEEGKVSKSHRGRWRSESILEEFPNSHKQDDAYEVERGIYTGNLDDDRNGHFRDYHHGNRESLREHKSSYSRREREKDRERELAMERERDRGRESKREKARHGEHKYEREREERGRRNRKRESRGSSREDRDRYSDRSIRQRRSDDLDNNGHAHHRRNSRYEIGIQRDRTIDLLKSEKQKTEETESEKPKSDEVEQEDYQEKIAFQLAQQEEEEEELARIKEESRRRR